MAKFISKVYLLDVPMEDDLKNTLYFATATAQQTYFQSKIGKTYLNVSYQDETRTFRCKDELEVVRKYNYIMWQNTAYSNKWFYGFIKSAKHVSDGYTDIEFEVDPIQTFMFDITIKPSFVEREHVNDDTEGLHTVPEGLELGDYEIVDLRDSPLWAEYGDSRDWLPCFCVTKLPSATTNLQSNGRIKNDIGYIGGVFSSLHFFATNTLTAGQEIINIYNNDPNLTADAIVNIFMVPSCCAYPISAGDSTINGHVLRALYNFYHVTDYDGSNPVPFKLQQPAVLAENYQPVNKKLLSYPYSYFYVTNKAGQTIEYKYEDFPFETIGSYTRRTISYEKTIIPCASLSAKLYFTNYKGYSETSASGTKMYTYGIDYPKIPVCAWTTDYYTNWLTQNGINVGTSLALGVAGAALGVATGGVGLVAGGLSLLGAISNTVGEVHQAQTTPPQAHGDVNTGDFQYAMQRSSISFYQMSVRPEVARIIDGYFSMFGYKVNTLKVPNVAHRQNWWYTKTIGANIVGDVPNDYMTKIKEAYDNGITFWRTPANFLDYSKPNGIV